MSTTNNPFQKAEKLQDQISELSLQPRIEVLPANQTTLLSKKTQDTIEELKNLEYRILLPRTKAIHQ